MKKITTPEFEEWLERQDIPIEDTMDIEDYIAYLRDEIGITGGSLEVAERIYGEKYDYLPQVGITPFKYIGEIMGIVYEETRYAIEGLRGAYGRARAYQIALERANERALVEAARWFRKAIETLRG